MAEKKIVEASAAESAVRRHLQAQYGDKLKSLFVTKCWYVPAPTSQAREHYDVEGTLTKKKGILRTEKENFRYQVATDDGSIIGYDKIIPK